MNIQTYQFILGLAGVIILGLTSFAFYILQLYVQDNKQFKKEQAEQNSRFYDLINATNITLTEVKEAIQADRRICDERHAKK